VVVVVVAQVHALGHRKNEGAARLGEGGLQRLLLGTAG